MRPLYEKIGIHGESDLPKEDGNYFVGHKDGYKDHWWFMKDNKEGINYWMSSIKYWLQPIEVDNSTEAEISDEIKSKVNNAIEGWFARQRISVKYSRELKNSIWQIFYKEDFYPSQLQSRQVKEEDKIDLSNPDYHHDCIQCGNSFWNKTKDNVICESCKSSITLKEVPDNKYPVYTLNCDKCEQPYSCADAYPEDQLCTKCFAEKYLKKEEVQPESNDAYYDRDKLFERQSAKQPEVSAEEVLKDELSEYYWDVITRKTLEGETLLKDWIIEAMERYAALKGK